MLDYKICHCEKLNIIPCDSFGIGKGGCAIVNWHDTILNSSTEELIFIIKSLCDFKNYLYKNKMVWIEATIKNYFPDRLNLYNKIILLK